MWLNCVLFCSTSTGTILSVPYGLCQVREWYSELKRHVCRSLEVCPDCTRTLIFAFLCVRCASVPHGHRRTGVRRRARGNNWAAATRSSSWRGTRKHAQPARSASERWV